MCKDNFFCSFKSVLCALLFMYKAGDRNIEFEHKDVVCCKTDIWPVCSLATTRQTEV
jgi:hypothetical protein